MALVALAATGVRRRTALREAAAMAARAVPAAGAAVVLEAQRQASPVRTAGMPAMAAAAEPVARGDSLRVCRVLPAQMVTAATGDTAAMAATVVGELMAASLPRTAALAATAVVEALLALVAPPAAPPPRRAPMGRPAMAAMEATAERA